MNEPYCMGAKPFLDSLPENSVHMLITSPPYYWARDYEGSEWVGGDPDCPHMADPGRNGADRKSRAPRPRALYGALCGRCGAERESVPLGLEDTPEDFVERLRAILSAARRPLRDGGMAAINIADCYAKPSTQGHRTKNLLGVPWMLAAAMKEDGWYWRNAIVWCKPDGIPDPNVNRLTPNTEAILMFCNGPREESFDRRNVPPKYQSDYWIMGTARTDWDYCDDCDTLFVGEQRKSIKKLSHRKMMGPGNRSKTDQETVRICPCGSQTGWVDHSAVYPDKLVEMLIRLGTSSKGCCAECGAPHLLKRRKAPNGKRSHQGRTKHTTAHRKGRSPPPEKGWQPTATISTWETTCECGADLEPCVVLDPFGGSFTTGRVAERMGHNWYSCDLSEKYCRIGSLLLERERRRRPEGRVPREATLLEFL